MKEKENLPEKWYEISDWEFCLATPWWLILPLVHIHLLSSNRGRHLWSLKYLKFPCVLSIRNLVIFLVSFPFFSIYWVIYTLVLSFPCKPDLDYDAFSVASVVKIAIKFWPRTKGCFRTIKDGQIGKSCVEENYAVHLIPILLN